MFAAVPQISSDQGRPGCALFPPRTGTSSPLRRREKRRTSVLGSPLPVPAPAPPPGSSLSKLKRRIRSNLCHEMPGERGEKKGEGCGAGGGIQVGLQVPAFSPADPPRALHLTLPPAPRVLVQPERRVPAICNYSGCFSGAPRCLGFVARAKAKLTKPHHRAVGLVWFSFFFFFLVPCRSKPYLASSTPLSSSSCLRFLIFQLGSLSLVDGASLSFFFPWDPGTIGM